MDRLHKAALEVAVWMPYTTEWFRQTVASILRALGAECLENVKPAEITWMEVALMEKILHAIHDKADVDYIAKKIFGVDKVEE